MNKQKSLLLALGMMICSAASAQIYITDGQFFPTGVTNDGKVVGHTDERSTHYIWDALNNTYTEIGGIAAGSGVGGTARFSADGKLVTATLQSDSIPVSTDWEKTVYTKFDYIFKDICAVSTNTLYAVGTSVDGDSGMIVSSSNNGTSWRRDDLVYDDNCPNYTFTSGIFCFGAASSSKYYAGGNKGRMYYCKGNGYWMPVDFHPEGDSSQVDTYTAIDFYKEDAWWKAHYCVVGMSLEDGGYAVWQSADSMETFQAATGVAGVPACITHVGQVFYLVTQNGYIQRSNDFGLTWETLFTLDSGDPFFSIRFADSQRGIATTYNVVYITRDGGQTWTKMDVLPTVSPWGSSIAWNDAAWNDSTVTIVGSLGQCYQSTDDGNVFQLQRIDNTSTNDFTALVYNNDNYNLIANGGNFYRKSAITSVSGYCAGIYDVENGTWTSLATTGYASDDSYASAYGISGDGSTVVGLGYNFYKGTNQIQAHAMTWSNSKLTDLGSKFADSNRSSRANACSYDGSVVVGWQDQWGPWFASMWTRNADGSYTQSLLLKDSTKTEDDVDFTSQDSTTANLLGYCQTVSADGKWIGGRGYNLVAVPGAWLYNTDTKEVKVLTESDATVSAISNDGSKVVGWNDQGFSAWIWIDGELQDLQTYATDELGCDLGDFVICSVYDMSPNGRYLAGYGMRGMEKFGYLLDLDAQADGIEQQSAIQVKAAVYPNPVSDVLHISLPYDANEVAANITLYDFAGHCVKAMKAQGVENELTVSDLAEGVYLLNVKAGKSKKTFKVIIRH
ncbi:MAG: T9SS type A sorting domain-containing protein [Prevotella sp.]